MNDLSEEIKKILKKCLTVESEVTYSECRGHEIHTIVKFNGEEICHTIGDAHKVIYGQ